MEVVVEPATPHPATICDEKSCVDAIVPLTMMHQDSSSSLDYGAGRSTQDLSGSGKEYASIITRQEEPCQEASCKTAPDENLSAELLAVFDDPQAPPKARKKKAPLEPKGAPLTPKWALHLAAWNEIAAKHGRPTIKELHETRKLKLRARLTEHPDLWAKIDAELSRMGQWGREQRFLTFDWILSPANLAKLFEGNYSRENEARGAPAYVDPDAHSKAVEAERKKIRDEIARNKFKKEVNELSKKATSSAATGGDQQPAQVHARDRGAREASRGGAGVDSGKDMARGRGLPVEDAPPWGAEPRRERGGDPVRGPERAGDRGRADRVSGSAGPAGPQAGRSAVPADQVSGAGR